MYYFMDGQTIYFHCARNTACILTRTGSLPASVEDGSRKRKVAQTLQWLEAKRRILVQDWLASIPTYLMGYIKFPKWAIQLVNSQLAHCFWDEYKVITNTICQLGVPLLCGKNLGGLVLLTLGI